MAEKQCNLVKNGGGADIDALETTVSSLSSLLTKVEKHTPIHANKALSSGLNIDLNNMYGSANETGYVVKGTTINIPADCQLAIREVLYLDSTHIYLRLTGFTTSNTLKTWLAFYNNGNWVSWQ